MADPYAAIAEPADPYDAIATLHKEDIPRAVASGAKRGLIGLPGMAGDMANLIGNLGNKLNLPQFTVEPGKGLVQIERQPMNTYAGPVATSGGINAAVDEKLGSKPYDAQTAGERYGNAIGYMAPALLGSPETGITRALAAMIGGGAGSEFAREHAPEKWKDEAGVAGGLLGGFAGAKAPGPGVVDRRMSAIADELEADPNRGAGMFGGNIRRKRKAPSAPLPEVDVNPTWAKRAGYLDPNKGLERFDAWNEPYLKTGVDPFKFQAYRNPEKAGALAAQPGETAEIARNALEGPITEGPPTGAIPKLQDRALGNLDEMAGTPAQLDAQYKAAQEAYKGVLTDEAVSPALKTRADEIIDRIDPKDHQWISDEVQRLARADGVKELNQAQKYQYAKSAIYHYAEDLATSPKTKMRSAKYMQVFNDLRDALHGDGGIPGYKVVDNAFEDIVTRKQSAEGLRAKIEGKTEGYSPGTIGLNRATLGDLGDTFGPDKSGKFALGQRVIRTDAKEYNLAHPDRGSQTAARLGEMLDNAGEGMRAVKKGPLEVAGHVAGGFWDKITGEILEGVRDEHGRDLFGAMTKADRAAFRAKIEQLAAQKRAQDLAAALAAGNAAHTQGTPNAP